MTKVIYENCRCLTREGEHLFFCTRKKAASYLKKGLAEMVSSEPFVFRLLFEPAGRGNPDQQPRENKCEICKTEEDLTKHHIVPYALRKLLSPQYKDHLSEDIVPLCEKHHREYEKSSLALRNKLLEECADMVEERKVIIRAKKAECNLEHHLENLSEERIALFKELLPHAKKPELSDFQMLLTKRTEKELYDLWKDDFVKWANAMGTEFEFKK